MRISDTIRVEHIVTNLAPGSKEQVMQDLLKPLMQDTTVADTGGIIEELITREQFMSTAIKPGLAIPHAYTPQVTEPQVVLGRCPTGTDFASFDGGPTYVFFLLLEPAGGQSMHLQVLSALSRLMSNAEILNELLQAPSASQMAEVLRAHEDGL